MYCNYCGKVIQDDHLHCAYCGKSVTGSIGRKRLVRPRERTIAGVCAGLGQYFDLDVTIIRVMWVLSVIFAGCGLVAYLVCWIVIPNEPVRYVVPPVPGGYANPTSS
jgi:phage shock protein C